MATEPFRLLQYLFDGLSIGSVYALLAIALVIIYRGTGHFNFAQGEMSLVATYLTLQVFLWGLPLWAATLVGAAAGFAVGAATQVAIVRPLEHRSEFAVFVAIIAVLLGLNALAGAIWGGDPLPFPNYFSNEPGDYLRIGEATWRYERLGVLAVTAVLVGLLALMFRWTSFGLAMRAVASNSDSALLNGIPVRRMRAASWGLAGFIGAFGAAMIAGVNTNITQTTMLSVLVSASAAATLGGMDSIGGALLAGLFIGVLESAAAGYLPELIGQNLRILPTLIIIVGVLVIKPSGLFGRKRVVRV